VPAVAPVTLYTMVQPPLGMSEPLATVMVLPAALVLGQVLDTWVPTVTLVGTASVNGAVSATPAPVELLMLIDSVPVPPTARVEGVKVLLGAGTALTVSVALAATAFEPPLVVVRPPTGMVLAYAPVAVAVTVTLMAGAGCACGGGHGARGDGEGVGERGTG
jgi:hypothetical protein